MYVTIRPSSPLFVSFEVTYECNNRCEYCYNYFCRVRQYKERESTLEEKKTVIDDIKNSNVFLVNFTGGEPMMSPDVFEVLSYCKEVGLIATLNTNGRLINEDKARKLKEIGLDGAMVSLSGSDAVKHDAQTGVKGSWSETVRGIKNLVKFEIPVIINFTITKKNYYDLWNIANLCKSLKVNLSISRFIPGYKQENYSKLELSREDINKIFHIIEKIKTQLGMDVDFKTPVPFCATKNLDFIKNIKPCQCAAGILFCFISPDFSVRLCPMSNETVGNLHYNTIKEIWNSKITQKALEKIHSFPNKCVTCLVFAYCRGGCRYSAIFHNSLSDPLADPPCKLPLSDSRQIISNIKIFLQDIPKIKKEFVTRSENFGTVIFFQDASYMFLIGDISTYIFSLINGKRKISDIINEVHSKYHLPENLIEKDVIDFFIELMLLNAIEVVRNETNRQ